MQDGIYDKFLAAFKTRAEQNKVGDPFHPETFQGPQVSELQFDRIMGYIQSGKEQGATVVTGGERHGDKGYFIQPTIFADVHPEMKIVQEEIFGPVCVISKFSTEEEVIKMGNDTCYGLAASLHTKDLNTSIRVSNALKAGTVWVNCKFMTCSHYLSRSICLTTPFTGHNLLSCALPFGGFKSSGIGRELGEAALANYTETKSVAINLGGKMF